MTGLPKKPARLQVTAPTFREWLVKLIAVYDEMVDETQYQVDQVAYNEVAHVLRRVRDRYNQDAK